MTSSPFATPAEVAAFLKLPDEDAVFGLPIPRFVLTTEAGDTIVRFHTEDVREYLADQRYSPKDNRWARPRARPAAPPDPRQDSRARHDDDAEPHRESFGQTEGSSPEERSDDHAGQPTGLLIGSRSDATAPSTTTADHTPSVHPPDHPPSVTTTADQQTALDDARRERAIDWLSSAMWTVEPWGTA